jgi:hypothetical protein
VKKSLGLGGLASLQLLIFEFFDFIECIESAFVQAGTFLCGGVPIIRSLQVVLPERPGAALSRTKIVNRTTFISIDGGKKNAILCLRMFLNGNSQANAAQIFFMKLRRSHIQMLRQFFNFLLCYPYNAFFGARAAIAALLAFEMKAGYVPFI